MRARGFQGRVPHSATVGTVARRENIIRSRPNRVSSVPLRPLRHLAAAGFEALRSVLLLGLRARASGLDKLLGAELALHGSLGDVHPAAALSLESRSLGRELRGLVVGGLAS